MILKSSVLIILPCRHNLKLILLSTQLGEEVRKELPDLLDFNMTPFQNFR